MCLNLFLPKTKNCAKQKLYTVFGRGDAIVRSLGDGIEIVRPLGAISSYVTQLRV